MDARFTAVDKGVEVLGRKAKKPFPIKAKRIGKLVKFDMRDIDRYIDEL